MKFYLLIVQNNSSQSVYAYDDLDDALSAFHSELAYRAEGRTSTMCLISDYQGCVVKKEYWQKEVNEE